MLSVEVITSAKLHLSILLFGVRLHSPRHRDQTTPNFLKKRKYLVDLGITRQLEFRPFRFCYSRTRPSRYRQSAGQQFFLQYCVLVLQPGDLGFQCHTLVWNGRTCPTDIVLTTPRRDWTKRPYPTDIAP